MTASLLEIFLGICHLPKRLDCTDSREAVPSSELWQLLWGWPVSGHHALTTHPSPIMRFATCLWELSQEVTREFEHRGNCVRSSIPLYAEKNNPGKKKKNPQLSCMGVSMAGKEQECVPEISRHFSGAAKLFPWNQFITNAPAFLAVETEISSPDCFIRGFSPFLEGWRGPGSLPVVYFNCCSAHNRSGSVGKILLILWKCIELLYTVEIHFLLLQNFKLGNSLPLPGISEALTAQTE